EHPYRLFHCSRQPAGNISPRVGVAGRVDKEVGFWQNEHPASRGIERKRMFSRWVVGLLIGMFAGGAPAAEQARLSREKYVDKCRGAWAGQMIGVCYGAPFEFRSNGRPITDPIEAWKPERVSGAIGQDDCYV